MKAQVLRWRERRPARNLQEHVAEELRAYMARRRISQVALAEALGIAGPTLSKRLSGQQPMTIDFIEDVCQLLGVGPAALFEWQPPDPDVRPRQGSNLRPSDYNVSVLPFKQITPPALALRQAS